MTWQEALEIVVARTNHERYRVLCDEDNPDRALREDMRRRVTEMAVVYTDPSTFQPSDVNPHHERWLLVAGCDYRGPRSRTGCDCENVCFRGVGGGRVRYRDCLVCVGVDI